MAPPTPSPTPPTNLASAPGYQPPDTWRAAAWLDGQPDVAAAVSAALLSGGAPGPADELTFLRGLPCTKKALRDRLEQGDILDKLADCLSTSLTDLQAAHAASAEELHDKFVADGKGFTLKLGGLKDFYGGLEAIIGTPSPQVEQAMLREHCESQDATTLFDMPNKKATTTSTIEWLFVANPAGGADGQGAPFAPYPNQADPRQPLAFDHFEAELKRRNDELEKEGHASVGKVEFYAARLYSGPMYLKYNAVLRGLQFDFMKSTFETLCLGNKYATTLHAINSSVIKLSKLTKAAKVYRGVSGGILPEVCRTANSYGVRGGVEGGFMSTTTDKATALFYASGGADRSKQGGPALVFETQMGMVDRGADVGWLSQFPKEEEILFAPLTGMEVRGSRVEGAVQIYEVALTVSMASLTIEQVLNKRHKLVREMAGGIVLDVRSELAGVAGIDGAKQAEWVRDQMEEKVLQQAPEHFNDDAKFVEAVEWALELKKEATDLKKIFEAVKDLEPAALAAYGSLLVRVLEDSSSYVRSVAVRTMGKLEPAALAQHGAALVAKLEDSYKDVRYAAVKTLGKLDLAALAQHGAALVARLVDSDSDVCKAAWEVLAKLGAEETLAQHAAVIVARLEDSNWPVRKAAVKTLGKLEPAALALYEQAIAKAAKEDKDSDVRRAAAEVLAKLQVHRMQQLINAGKVDDVVAKLEGSEWQVQIAARVMMHKLEPAAGHMDAVAAKLEDSDENVREAAVQTLGKLEAAALAQHGVALAARLEDSHREVRRAAVEMLGKLEPAALAQHGAALVARLEDSVSGVRKAAVATLGKLEAAALALHEQAIAKAAKEDKVSDTRRAAAEVLAKLRAGV